MPTRSPSLWKPRQHRIRQTMNTPNPLQGWALELRDIRKAMKREGVRRISCFNGGLTDRERYFNGEIFRLETTIKKYSK